MLKFDFFDKNSRKLSKLLMKVVPLSILLLFLTGCNLTGYFNPTPEMEIPPGSILMKDDFSTDDHGWKTWNQDGSLVAYQAGTLRFFIAQPDLDFWSRPGYDFKDVRIEVDAIKVDGPDNNAFGVICRMQDAENFYSFLISSDGYAGILRVLDGEYKLLNHENMEFSQDILQGDALNHITAVCNGSQLALSVNDKELFSIEDTNFLTGDVGLMAGSYQEPDVDIVFDDFIVYQP